MKALLICNDYLIDPLGPAYLSSYLKAAGHQVEIVKAKREDPIAKKEHFLPAMRDRGYDLATTGIGDES